MKLRRGILIAFLFIGCGNNNDRIRDRAQIEAEENATRSVAAEQDFRQKRAVEMEKDLKQRMRFIQAITGAFEGTFFNEGMQPARMSLNISASLPAFVPDDRIRTPEEVAVDLAQLFVQVVVNEWDENLPLGGCAFESVRPDIERGEFHLVSKECESSYTLRINQDNKEFSAKPSERILSGVVSKVQTLSGVRRAHFVSTPFSVELQRVSN